MFKKGIDITNSNQFQYNNVMKLNACVRVHGGLWLCWLWATRKNQVLHYQPSFSRIIKLSFPVKYLDLPPLIVLHIRFNNVTGWLAAWCCASTVFLYLYYYYY